MLLLNIRLDNMLMYLCFIVKYLIKHSNMFNVLTTTKLLIYIYVL